MICQCGYDSGGDRLKLARHRSEVHSGKKVVKTLEPVKVEPAKRKRKKKTPSAE